jgi:hypothetical protein
LQMGGLMPEKMVEYANGGLRLCKRGLMYESGRRNVRKRVQKMSSQTGGLGVGMQTGDVAPTYAVSFEWPEDQHVWTPSQKSENVRKSVLGMICKRGA